MPIYPKEEPINYLTRNRIQIINSNQYLLEIYNKFNKKDQVYLNTKIRAYNIELLGYIKGLLDATDLPIVSPDEVPKKQQKKKKAHRKANARALIKAKLAELEMYSRYTAERRAAKEVRKGPLRKDPTVINPSL